MKKISALALSLALCVGLLAGCGNGAANGGGTASSSAPSTAPSAAPSSAPSTAPESSAPVALSGVVNTNGSTSMEKVIGSLAEAFMEQGGDVTVNYDPTGSGTGITAVKDGTCDIGLSSRDLKDEEIAAGLKGTVLALDGIAIVVNPQNTVTDLTIEQIAGLFTGTITNWKDVGGPDAPVVPIGREAGSGTRDGFESITGTAEKCTYTQELTSTGDVITTVAGNPNAIGYASLASLKDNVKAVSVGGVVPSEATVLDGTYTVQRDFVLVTSESKPLSAEAQAFLDYALSAEAAPIITAAGAVPLAK